MDKQYSQRGINMENKISNNTELPDREVYLGYSREAIANLSDKELVDIYKDFWGLNDGNILVGKLRITEGINNNTMYFLEELTYIHKDLKQERAKYPFEILRSQSGPKKSLSILLSGKIPEELIKTSDHKPLYFEIKNFKAGAKFERNKKDYNDEYSNPAALATTKNDISAVTDFFEDIDTTINISDLTTALMERVTDTTTQIENLEKANDELIEAQEKIKKTGNAALIEAQERMDELDEKVTAKEKYLDEIVEHINTLKKNFNTTEIEMLDDEEDELGLGKYDDKPKEAIKDIELSKLGEEIHKRVENQGYSYDLGKINNILALLKSNKICIFTGTCGCGKSALIQALGKACGFAVSFIPVKTNWHSPEDMLGYYDNAQKRFIPTTPFIKAINIAKRQKDRLHIIALDEMNLARIEYYFSDILSLSEMRDSSDRSITLYSHSLSNNDENDDAENTENIENNSRNRMVLKTKKLHIPDNVRFIGTMNIDETTYSLSPKVLDRVHIVRFESNLEGFDYKKPIVDDTYKDQTLSFSEYFDKKLELQNLDQKYKKILIAINDILKEYQKEFGYRVYTQCVEYRTIYDDMGLPTDIGFDNFICQKILPRIDMLDPEETHIVDKLLNILEDSPIKFDNSRSLLENIKNTPRAKIRKYYSFWDI